MSDRIRQLQGYRLTTAEILYYLPDQPHLLQSFIWQTLDLAPRFPELRRFLDFWTRSVEGRIHSVTMCHAPVATSRRLRHAAVSLEIH